MEGNEGSIAAIRQAPGSEPTASSNKLLLTGAGSVLHAACQPDW